MLKRNDEAPSLGATVEEGGVRFRVWAPEAKSIEVVPDGKAHELRHSCEGYWNGFFSNMLAGALYRYRIDGDRILPDPASRFQPEGVHGPSQVIDPNVFVWSDENWKGIRMEELIIYELHTGTFTQDGRFAGVIEQLPYLANLGITAIELMPVADFPGRWNWGYDDASLFAPARCYGVPDDLRKLVNESHRHGIAVLLDVVYNHFGPDGAYAGSYSPYYFSRKHKTPWGDAINLDGDQSRPVRDFLIENALYWLCEFHMDGLRLDATHALIDESPKHFLAELSARIKKALPDRNVLLIAEDHRNLAQVVKPESERGWGLDGVWSDDFHHQIRRMLVGDRDGYFQDFNGTTDELAETINKGWLFSGQYAAYFDSHRGTDPSGIPADRFVFFLQNHDQVGNRALGERIHHQIDPAVYRAVSALFLCLPQTPLLFQGQEWAASTPFCYFTDHNEELGKLVTQGRREEFARFSEFSDPEKRNSIPDPQAVATFERSRLKWPEIVQEPHASILRLYQALLKLRKTVPALKYSKENTHQAILLNQNAILVKRSAADGSTILVVAQLKGSGTVSLKQWAGPREVLLTTEDSDFAIDSLLPRIDLPAFEIHFQRPSAVVALASGRQFVTPTRLSQNARKGMFTLCNARF